MAAQERDFARALSEADSAVALAPYDALLLGDLSEVLIMSGRPQQAIEWTSKAVINDPAMAWYYRGTQGWAYESQGKYQEVAGGAEVEQDGRLHFLSAIDGD